MAKEILLTPTIIAAGLGVSEKTVTNRLTVRAFPDPDVRGHGNCKFWKISTIRAHDPALAERCVRILAALADSPAQAA